MADAKTEKQKVKEITDKLEGTGYEGDGVPYRTHFILLPENGMDKN